MPIDSNFEESAVDVGQAIYLHHYPDNSKPRGYYFDLLELSVKENPDDCHVRMLYAREFLVKGETQRGLDEFLKVLGMPDVNQPTKRLVLLNSLLQVALTYNQLQNYDEAIWYCQEFIKEDPTYREPYFLLAEMYNNMKMYTLAEACTTTAEKYCTHKYNWVERANTWS